MYNKKVKLDNGWGYIIKTISYDRNLKYCPYGSCGVNIHDGTIHLISYDTCAVSIDKDGWLKCSCIYSATTRKHIGAFLKEYAPNITYQDAKYMYYNGARINIYTRAIRKLP